MSQFANQEAQSNPMDYEQALYLALHCPLTGLKNRHALDHNLPLAITEAFTQNRPLSFMILDLDFFKSLNDTHGHLAGDLALKEVGKIVTALLGEKHEAYRYGGEEFCILMRDTQLNGAMRMADKLRKSIAQALIIHDNQPFSITASMGVTQLEHKDSVQALIARADSALYRAKNAGRNQAIADKLLIVKHTRV